MTTKKTRKPVMKPKRKSRSLALGTCSPSEKIVGTGFYRDTKPGTFGLNEWLDLLMACQDGRATCLRVMEIMDREAELNRPSAHDLAEAFLRWPLPDSVCADLCATKQGPGRVGTNLLSYVEAKQMFEQLLPNDQISNDPPTR